MGCFFPNYAKNSARCAVRRRPVLDKKDLNKYNTSTFHVPSQRTEGEMSQTASATAKTVGGMVWKAVKTLVCILIISGLLVFLSVASFLLSFRDAEPPDLSAMSLSYSSFVYLDDDQGNSTEYMTIYRNENRVWTSLNDIPTYMKTAQVAIEDHRFSEHHGVDWWNTMGAVYKLFTHSGSGGGSTLTQQLIKNLTQQNQVSILRKVGEIFTALNLEKKYSKQQILEAYLNVVNYGGQCQGVEAAAECYFDKNISECSLAECALIAGITQNPYQYNPLIFPEESKERARTVLDRMWRLSDGDQSNDELVITGDLEGQLAPITKDEYEQALAELDTMSFVGGEVEDTDAENEEKQDTDKWNWYIDTMFNDIVADLQEKYGYSYDQARSLVYNSGLEIHCAMNLQIQTDLEEMFLHGDCMPADPDIQAGLFVMDPYTGRVIAVVGSRDQRDGVLLWNNATQSERQPGSSFKPVSAYSLGIETGTITYGSVLKDQPIPNYYGEGSTEEGPSNFSMHYTGYMNVDEAIEVSQNAPAAWLVSELTPESCYQWLTDKLHFTTLTEDDSHSLSAMALGGMSYGVTVEEMTTAYCTFANGGYYYEPYTYTYVKDHQGNVILDNRDKTGEQVMSTETATIMNKLLHRPVEGYNGTATTMQDLGVDIYAKTGTTNDTKDLTFMGGTPYCVAGVWTGYEEPAEIADSNVARVVWKAVIQYLNTYDWGDVGWVLSDKVSQYTFCRTSGKIAGPNCYDTAVGWYDPSNLPGTCNGGSDHIAGPAASVSPSPSVSPSASTEPSEEPSPSPSTSVTESPTPGPSTPETPTPETPTPETPTPETPTPETPTPETPTPETPTPETPTPDTPAPDPGGNEGEGGTGELVG